MAVNMLFEEWWSSCGRFIDPDTYWIARIEPEDEPS